MIRLPYNEIYVISLSDTISLRSHYINKIPFAFTLFPAIKNEVGHEGLKFTFRDLFADLLHRGVENAIIFEDDVKFLTDNAMEDFNACISELPDDYFMLHFGCNMLAPAKPYGKNLIEVVMSYALHATMYSRAAMEKIYAILDDQYINYQKNTPKEPLDLIIAKLFQRREKIYCSSKLLTTQWPSVSSIFKYDQKVNTNIGEIYDPKTNVINWNKLIVDNWERNTKHLETK